jgi:excisionase family DNA binding protein
MTNPEPFDLSTTAAAALVGCHPETVKRWAMKGELPSFLTPGGHYRFRRSDVEALLAGTSGGAA